MPRARAGSRSGTSASTSSSTTPDDAGFSTVVSGVALDNSTLQEFVFAGGPVDARFVRLFAVDKLCQHLLRRLQRAPGHPVPTASPRTRATRTPPIGRRTCSTTATAPMADRQRPGHEPVRRARPRRGDAARPACASRRQPSPHRRRARLRVLVSTTTDDNAAFTGVLSATLANNGLLQEFVFPGGPARARFLRLLVKNNYGSTNLIRLATLEAVAARSEGNIVTLPAAPKDVTGLESPSLIANGPRWWPSAAPSTSTTSPRTCWTTWPATRGRRALRSTRSSRPSGSAARRAQPRRGQNLAARGHGLHPIGEGLRGVGLLHHRRRLRVHQGPDRHRGQRQTLQTFLFPGGAVPARYVKYMPKSNQGDPVRCRPATSRSSPRPRRRRERDQLQRLLEPSGVRAGRELGDGGLAHAHGQRDQPVDHLEALGRDQPSALRRVRLAGRLVRAQGLRDPGLETRPRRTTPRSRRWRRAPSPAPTPARDPLQRPHAGHLRALPLEDGPLHELHRRARAGGAGGSIRGRGGGRE